MLSTNSCRMAEYKEITDQISSLHSAIRELTRVKNPQIVLSDGRFKVVSKESSKDSTKISILEDVKHLLKKAINTINDGQSKEILKNAWTLKNDLGYIEDWVKLYFDQSKCNYSIHSSSEKLVRSVYKKVEGVKKALAHKQLTDLSGELNTRCSTMIKNLEYHSAAIRRSVLTSARLEDMPNLSDQIIQNLDQVSYILTDMSTLALEVNDFIKPIELNFQSLVELLEEVTLPDGSTEIKTTILKTIHLKTNKDDSAEALKQLDQFIKELGKLREAAIYFLESSHSDEINFFLVPESDPEPLNPALQPTVNDEINEKSAQADQWITYCYQLLKNRPSPNNRALILLSFQKAYQYLTASFKAYHAKFQLNTGDEQWKANIQTNNVRVQLIEKKLFWSNIKLFFCRFLPFLFDVKSMRDQIQQMQRLVLKRKGEIEMDNENIKKMASEGKNREKAFARMNAAMHAHDSLKVALTNAHVLDDTPLLLSLNNPILQGNFAVSPTDLLEVADVYSFYISKLQEVKESAGKGARDLTRLRDLISDAASSK